MRLSGPASTQASSRVSGWASAFALLSLAGWLVQDVQATAADGHGRLSRSRRRLGERQQTIIEDGQWMTILAARMAGWLQGPNGADILDLHRLDHHDLRASVNDEF